MISTTLYSSTGPPPWSLCRSRGREPLKYHASRQRDPLAALESLYRKIDKLYKASAGLDSPEARVILKRPRFLLLDEPTSALDPENAHAVVASVKNLSATGLMTVVAITHNQEFVDAAHRVYRLDEGRLREIDSTRALQGVDGG